MKKKDQNFLIGMAGGALGLYLLGRLGAKPSSHENPTEIPGDSWFSVEGEIAVPSPNITRALVCTSRNDVEPVAVSTRIAAVASMLREAAIQLIEQRAEVVDLVDGNEPIPAPAYAATLSRAAGILDGLSGEQWREIEAQILAQTDMGGEVWPDCDEIEDWQNVPTPAVAGPLGVLLEEIEGVPQ